MQATKSDGSILVVDDDAQILQLYSKCLRLAGYNVWEARTGGECLKVVRERRPDLVLLDVRLPDVDGIEVCRQIKLDPDLPDILVILCSGDAISSVDKVDGLETGADDYLTKPVSFSELVARIRMLMRLRHSVIELRASEEYHRRLIEILPDAVCLVAQDGRILSVNSQAVAMLGCQDQTELIGKNFFELAPPANQAQIKNDFNTVLNAGIVRDVEHAVMKSSGAALRVELSATVSPGGRGRQAGLLCVMHDITERREAAERIHQLLTLLDQAHDAIIVCDLMDHIGYFNMGAERLLGRKAQEVQGCRVTDLFLRNDETYSKAKDMLMKAGQWCGELMGFSRNGDPINFDSRWTLARFSRESSPLVVSIYTDITERKLAEQKLKEQEMFSRHILGVAMEGYCRLDATGRFLDVNEAYCQMTGYSRKELLLKNISDLDLNRPVADLAAQQMRRVLKSGGERFETRYRRKRGGPVDVEVIATSLKLQGNFIFEFSRDVTERKRVEEELRMLHRRIIEVQEAERLRLAFEIHDGINQLIASVKMRLKNVGISLPRLKPAAREILGRCDQLLTRALEENRRIARNLRPSDLDDFGLFAACRNFCEEMRLRTSIKIQYRIAKYSRRLPPAVELNLFRIVQEAINNIEKHAHAKSIKLNLGFRRSAIGLTIQDDGRGFEIQKADQSREKNQGLGLTNMRERTISLGGTCKIKSAPKQGTTITVIVPLSDGAKGMGAPANRIAPNRGGSVRNVFDPADGVTDQGI